MIEDTLYSLSAVFSQGQNSTGTTGAGGTLNVTVEELPDNAFITIKTEDGYSFDDAEQAKKFIALVEQAAKSIVEGMK